MAFKRIITQEKYNIIKGVLDMIPKRQKGVCQMYKTMGIGSSTASYIRRSENFKGYKELLKRDTQRSKDKNIKEMVGEVVEQTTANTARDFQFETILEKLNSIQAQLTVHDKEFEDFKKLYAWVAEHAVVENGKKAWYR